jgi:16S rRNA processing protein RimM
MRKEECFELGTFTKLHGFKGELIARALTDHPEWYTTIESVWLETTNGLVPFFVERISQLPNGSLRFKLEGVQTEAEARALVGQTIYLTEDPAVREGFFLEDLVGFQVNNAHGIPVGTITEVHTQTAQPFLELLAQGKTAYLPFHEDLILEINEEQQLLVFEIPDGLLELY